VRLRGRGERRAASRICSSSSSSAPRVHAQGQPHHHCTYALEADTCWSSFPGALEDTEVKGVAPQKHQCLQEHREQRAAWRICSSSTEEAEIQGRSLCLCRQRVQRGDDLPDWLLRSSSSETLVWLQGHTECRARSICSSSAEEEEE